MISNKQQEILSFITAYQQKHKRNPTLDEIAKNFQKSIATVHQHVQSLKMKGYLKVPTGDSRTYGTFTLDENIVEVPLLGFVSAGGGIENLESPEPIKVQQSLISSSGLHYALIVRGTSMIDDGILPDDIIICRQQTYADNGDIVIALLYDDSDTQLATVKRFYKQGSRIELRPRNPSLKSRFYNVGEIEIRGKFVGLLRNG